MFSSLDINNLDNAPLAVIYGLEGTSLSKSEKEFFKDANPAGFILFKRNIEDPKQVKKLTDSLQSLLGRAVPILADQEGGRVQRFRPPHWNEWPNAAHFGSTFLRDFQKGRQEVRDAGTGIAKELAAAGVNVNCAPCMDILFAQTHESIGDRAFSNDPEIVAMLAATMAEAFLKEGIVPVMKHMPGHGRAITDSHESLPEVDASREEMMRSDFVPFREILTKVYSEPMWGMVSHVLYHDIDARTPASCSRKVIYDAIRHDIGFQGLLLSDDINMDALNTMGGMAYRAEKVLRAGCDLALHCNGDMTEMVAIAGRATKMDADAIERFNRTVEWFEWSS